MSINKQALREAAEKATPGEWCADDMYGVVADAGLNGKFYIATCSGPENRDNKRFIAAVNPATVLALLDELEAAEKRIARLEVLTFCPASLDVMSERQRQRAVEGWTSDRDDAYQNSELADAAACYAIHAHNQGFSTPAHWPWAPSWWKQTNPRRDLVKAGALILAEIERIDRAAGIITGVEE